VESSLPLPPSLSLSLCFSFGQVYRMRALLYARTHVFFQRVYARASSFSRFGCPLAGVTSGINNARACRRISFSLCFVAREVTSCRRALVFSDGSLRKVAVGTADSWCVDGSFIADATPTCRQSRARTRGRACVGACVRETERRDAGQVREVAHAAYIGRRDGVGGVHN